MTDRYENIRKALAIEDLNDLMCPHSAAGRPERFHAKACIFAGECGCEYGAELSRALRLADDAARGLRQHGRCVRAGDSGDTVLRDKITIEELRARVEYDASSGKFTWLHCDSCRPCWNSRFVGKQALCSPHSNGYLFGEIANQKLFAHRVAWAIYYGHWPDGEIDHINHDKTDNRIANLRVVHRTQNAMNLPKSKRNSSGVTGVFRHAQTGRWQAQIRIGGTSIHLGSFEAFDDAVAARRKAEEQHGFHQNHSI